MSTTAPQDPQTPQSPDPSEAPQSPVRLAAITATVLALLAVSIPFVWNHEARVAAEAVDASPAMVPLAAHGAEAPDQGAACPANAKPAPDWSLPGIDGKTYRLRDFRGKVVLLNFWATWCGPCKAEVPAFVELQTQYKKDLAVIGFSVDDSLDKAKAFAAEYKVNYPMVLGEGHEDIQDAYGPLYGIPATFLISRDGKVCKTHMGIAPKSQFEKEITALM